MYTKTLAAVLVIATAEASRLTARRGRNDTAPTVSADASASASGAASATTAALSISHPGHWQPTCDVRSSFSYNVPQLWYAASVPDLMDCTQEMSVTGTWQNDKDYRLTLSGYDSICRAHMMVGPVTNYKYECLEAGWYPTDDYNDAWCNDYDRTYYEYTKDPKNPDCNKWQQDMSNSDLPLVCNDFNRWVCPPELAGKWSASGNYYCTETGAWTTRPLGGTLTANPNANNAMPGASSGTWPPSEQEDPSCPSVGPIPSPPVVPVVPVRPVVPTPTPKPPVNPILPPITPPITPPAISCPIGAHRDCDPMTWGPPAGCNPGMVGCDGCSWAPHHPAHCPIGFVGCDTSSWNVTPVPCPSTAGFGCDPRTWGPVTGCSKGQLGCEPATWGPGAGTFPVCPHGYVGCDPSGWEPVISPTLPKPDEECEEWQHQTTMIFQDYPFTCTKWGSNYYWDCGKEEWKQRIGDNPNKEQLWCDTVHYHWTEQPTYGTAP